MARLVWHGRTVEGAIQAAVLRAVRKTAAAGEGQAKLNASGRPGPQVQTGRLRSSITHDADLEGNVAVGRVGTDVKYARRIELGFIGTDSLGRNYHQPPYAFLTPMINFLKSVLFKSAADELGRL